MLGDPNPAPFLMRLDDCSADVRKVGSTFRIAEISRRCSLGISMLSWNAYADP